jgi:hypothetical protein
MTALFHICSNPQDTSYWVMTSPLSSVLIHILLQVGREIFLSHPFQYKKQYIFGQDGIIYHLFLSMYHLKLSMTSSSIICSNSNTTLNSSRKLPVTSFPLHIALQIRSWQHYFRICSNPHSTSYYLMTSSYIICSNAHITSNWSWKLPVTSFPILIALLIGS